MVFDVVWDESAEKWAVKDNVGNLKHHRKRRKEAEKKAKGMAQQKANNMERTITVYVEHKAGTISHKQQIKPSGER